MRAFRPDGSSESNLLYQSGLSKSLPQLEMTPMNRHFGFRFISSRLLAMIGVLAVGSAISSCNFSATPSKTVENLCRAVERGEIDRAMTFLSSGFIGRQGIESVKQGLSQVSLEMKEHGGIKAIKVSKEDVVGEVAEVSAEITRGNGIVGAARYKLVRERGEWKIDDISGNSSSQNEPVHPETAVADVVKWAHETGADKLVSWFQKQAAPPVCKVGKLDRSTLPDEVKYHDVADGKQRDRLLTGLEPVIKLIGCSNKDGVVLYDGLTIYAGSLPDGHIAITPGSSYLVSSIPQENIFHDLAKLRIFLAREVFRQMISTEKASNGLNDADMLLQRELKLNYLAAMVSLATDKDPSIFDAAALDIDAYAKPVGIVSGTQGTPSLRQVQDIFGAAKQDFGDASR